MSASAVETAPIPKLVQRQASGAFAVAWALVGLAALVMLWVMTHVWASLPEMNDRFLIPAASGWLLWRNLPRWRATASAPTLSGLPLLALAAVCIPMVWFLLVQVGPRAILLWWLLTALLGAAFGLLVMQFGWRKSWQAAFPLAFCYLALPAPGKVGGPLQIWLKECTTHATATVLPWLGIPTERLGHTLELPSGRLGVVDACSGVRSVTALTAIALFVAYLRRFSIPRGAVLIAITMAIVIASNSVRVIITGVLQESFGVEFTQGVAHDILGYSVILVGLALIVGVAALISPTRIAAEPAQAVTAVPRSASGGLAAVVVLVLSLGAALWTERFRDEHRTIVQLDELPSSFAGWNGRDVPIPALVEDLLKCDQIVHRAYQDRVGHEIELYLMFWATPLSTAHLHHPDICMTCQGWTIESSRTRLVPFMSGKAPIPVSVRTYRQGNLRSLVFYWTQSGTEVLPDGAEDPAQVSDFAWIRTMLTGQAALERTSRLSVRLDMDAPAASEHQESLVAEMCGIVAREVYALCPWALPPS